jgi:hypothetical protein
VLCQKHADYVVHGGGAVRHDGLFDPFTIKHKSQADTRFRTVDIRRKTCDCGRWAMLKIPCWHAMAAIKSACRLVNANVGDADRYFLQSVALNVPMCLRAASLPWCYARQATGIPRPDPRTPLSVESQSLGCPKIYLAKWAEKKKRGPAQHKRRRSFLEPRS